MYNNLPTLAQWTRESSERKTSDVSVLLTRCDWIKRDKRQIIIKPRCSNVGRFQWQPFGPFSQTKIFSFFCFFLHSICFPFFFFLPFISRTMVLFARQYSMIGYLAAGHSVLFCWNSHCCCRFRLSVYGPFTIEGVTGRCQIQFNMLGHTVNVFACVWGLCILPNVKMWTTLPFFLIPCH